MILQIVQQKEKLKNAALRCINNFQLQQVYTKPKNTWITHPYSL